MRSEDWVNRSSLPGLRVETTDRQILPGPQGRGTGGTQHEWCTQFRESPGDFVCLGERSGWLWEWSSI
jgi:hypothetical protein